MTDTTVVAVVVTWNRRALLAETLAALRAQTRPPERVVVVDNASDDGTADDLAALADDPWVEVVTALTNTGGAGGFALGLRAGLQGGCDALWLMDDDTVPTPGALAALLAAREADPLGTPAVVASRVVWTDGRDHPMNTPRPSPFATRTEREAAARVGCVPVRSASFVSILVDAARVRERGLPVADYFLWNDDFEYSTRLVRGGHGLYCPSSVVVHKTKAFGATDADPGPRFYYEVRNKVWMWTRSPSLTPWEKVVYGGSSLLRWGRTVARSGDRATLAGGLGRGLRDGLRAGPRPTELILAEALPQESGAPGGEAFSVLMCVYRGDDPDHLAEAFASVTTEQTRRPAQVVLVQDGPVPVALQAAIRELVLASVVPVDLVPLATNRGLGVALSAGLSRCEHDIVARMDADDVALPERFAVQVPLVEAGADVVGSGMLEIAGSREEVVGSRVPPLTPERIVTSARIAQPFNHPTVVYRRSAVEAAGGYQDFRQMEDYLLFARMIQGGARVANVAEPLLCYRVSEGAYARRGGWSMLRTELALQRRFLAMGFTTPGQWVRNVAVRGVYRLVPEQLRKVAYRAVMAQRGGRR